MGALCITCWNDAAVPGCKQCLRCQGYPDGDPEWISPGCGRTGKATTESGGLT
jgi:hypothetical protein